MDVHTPLSLASSDLGELLVQDAPSWSGSHMDGAPALQGPHFLKEYAPRLFAYEALDSAPPPRAQEEVEPYSLQWFLNIENRRHSRQGRWIPKLLEFTKHAGETLLGLGHGLGTDWVQYARNDANVVVCSPSSPQLEVVRRNFEVRGLKGRFIQASPGSLPLDSASIDVAMVSSLMHGIDNPWQVAAEVYRVLKPGGKVLAVTSARYDVDYWFNTLFFWYRWLGGKPAESKVPPEHKYTGRQMRRLFQPFVEAKVYKRQLRRSEVPHLWRGIPTSLLARWMGRVLVFKGFKPVRTVAVEGDSDSVRQQEWEWDRRLAG